jgi:hypothetical protein
LADGRIAVVHLTWTGKQDTTPLPRTCLYATQEKFHQDRMIPDHHEWSELEATSPADLDGGHTANISSICRAAATPLWSESAAERATPHIA